MAKQTISTGSAANDGTGDTLRSAGIKINANFTELYNRQTIPYYDSETLTANGAVSIIVPLTICNKASALALALPNSGTTGQVKVFTNKGAGIATITPTSFAHGTSVALDQYDAVTMVWDGAKWYITGHYGATVA